MPDRPGFLRRPGRGRRGFTLVETVIAVAISSVVMLALISLQYISGAIVKDVYGQTRTRSSRMNAIDQIRYRLINGRQGQVTISSDRHVITYRDPTLTPPTDVTSRFRFVPGQNTLFYDSNINDSTSEVALVQGPIDITFSLGTSSLVSDSATSYGLPLVTVRVKSASNISSGDIDKQDGETAVCLRNPALP